jgi:hypothetical protein
VPAARARYAITSRTKTERGCMSFKLAQRPGG